LTGMTNPVTLEINGDELYWISVVPSLCISRFFRVSHPKQGRQKRKSKKGTEMQKERELSVVLNEVMYTRKIKT